MRCRGRPHAIRKSQKSPRELQSTWLRWGSCLRRRRVLKLRENMVQRKIKPSEIGYFGQGVPDPDTMSKLQNAFAENIVNNGCIAPALREKFEHMQKLRRKAFAGPKVDKQALLAATELAGELLPILHFQVDDVDWGP